LLSFILGAAVEPLARDQKLGREARRAASFGKGSPHTCRTAMAELAWSGQWIRVRSGQAALKVKG
jgi:hypothetical protein